MYSDELPRLAEFRLEVHFPKIKSDYLSLTWHVQTKHMYTNGKAKKKKHTHTQCT